MTPLLRTNDGAQSVKLKEKMMTTLTKTLACCFFLVAIADLAESAESIAYRLTNAKEMHFDDPQKAELHLAAVKKLGCEASLDAHNGHTDVTYKSVRWQSIEVATDNLAHQWEDWLQQAGFETIHGHAANHGEEDHAGHDHSGHNHGPGEAEEVAYQLASWKTIHVEDETQGAQLVAIMNGLGCEVRSEKHERHADISVRCPTWKHIEFPSHRAATNWEGWLKQTGFDTRHEH